VIEDDFVRHQQVVAGIDTTSAGTLIPSALAGVEFTTDDQSTPTMSSAVMAKPGCVRIAACARNRRTVVSMFITRNAFNEAATVDPSACVQIHDPFDLGAISLQQRMGILVCAAKEGSG
jgi:hypothetical protein